MAADARNELADGSLKLAEINIWFHGIIDANVRHKNLHSSLLRFAPERGYVSRGNSGACSDAYGSSSQNHPRAVHVIHNAVDVVFRHMESDGCVGRPGISAALQNDYHRFAIHFAHSQLPWHRESFVIAEVRRIDEFPSKRIGHPQTGIGGNQFPQPVPVAADVLLSNKHP